eukprot:3052573-Rhodomonas_salina.3
MRVWPDTHSRIYPGRVSPGFLPARLPRQWLLGSNFSSVLCLCYAMSGTDLAYAAIRSSRSPTP